MFAYMFRPQHLCGIQLVSEMCSGQLIAAQVGLGEIELTPQDFITGQAYNKQVRTAGSVNE